ncbi:hypothetical protein [Maridesulfovibrio sp.]|uniref:AbiTii domain-containing protein n=1 Tax=Maridesulfovibrio sp. TaxID=2795000 RepID=UPI0039EF62BE
MIITLDEIVKMATSTDTAIADLLRKCLILAYRLDLKEFQNWAKLELNGFSDINILPDYRIIPVFLYGTFSNEYDTHHDHPIPISSIPEQLRDRLRFVHLCESIGAIEQSVLPMAHKQQGIKMSWPPDLVNAVNREICKGQPYELINAYQGLSESSVHDLIEIVKNRILEFALELKRMGINLTEEKDNNPIDNTPVRQIFNTIVLGDNKGSISGNQKDVSISINNAERCNFDSLQTILNDSGVPSEEIDTLKEAFENDNNTIGERVSNWIGQFTSNVTTGAITNFSIDKLPVVLEAIRQFAGA